MELIAKKIVLFVLGIALVISVISLLINIVHKIEGLYPTLAWSWVILLLTLGLIVQVIYKMQLE